MVVATQTIEQPSDAISRSPESPIKVLLDARKLGDGGIGAYIENLLDGLSAHDSVQLTALVRPGQREHHSLADNISIIEDRAALYSVDELVFMPRRVDFSRFDLFHVPHYTLPYFVKIPTIVTVHDLIHITHPQHWYYPYLSKFMIRSALQRASRVVTVSQSSKDEIFRLFGTDKAIHGKVDVIPNMISPFYLERVERNGSAATSVRRNGRYLLAIMSNLKPHKGLLDLVEAYEIAFERLRHSSKREGRENSLSDLKLVIVGQGFRNMDGAEALLKKIDPVKGIHLAGEVTAEELRDLYSRAMAVVVPSKIEGFCMPVIEAHACGVPVVARPVPAVRELCTKYDVLANDMSIDALANSIVQLCERALKQDAREVALSLQSELARFDSQRVSQMTADLYQSVISAAGDKK